MEEESASTTTSRPNLTPTKSSLKPQKVLWLRNLVRSVSTRSSSSNTVNNQITKAPSTTTSLRTSQKLFPFQSIPSAPLPSATTTTTTQNEDKQTTKLNQLSTVSKTPLVEIKSRPPDQDHARKIVGDPINQSVFDDLPPPELYDPSWNTLPLRCEAGVLGKQSDQHDSSQPKGPILPVAFTLHSSDLEDDSEEEDEYDEEEMDYQSEQQTNNHEVKNIESLPIEKDFITSEATSDQQSEKTDSDMQNARHRSSLRSERSMSSIRAIEEGTNSPGDVIKHTGSGQRKSLWRKVTAGKNGSGKRSSMFQAAHPMMVVMEDIRLLIEEDYGGGVNGFKNGEVRAKIPITINENENVYQMVFTIEEKNVSGECTVWIRRSFGETFRISNEDFDWFCEGFTTRFKQLRQFDHLAKRKSSALPTLSNSEEK